MLVKTEQRVRQETKISATGSLWGDQTILTQQDCLKFSLVLLCLPSIRLQELLWHPILHYSQTGLNLLDRGWVLWFYRNKELGVIRIAMEADSVAVDNVAQGKRVDCKKQWTEDWPLWNTKAWFAMLWFWTLAEHKLCCICEVRIKPATSRTQDSKEECCVRSCWMQHWGPATQASRQIVCDLLCCNPFLTGKGGSI